jgi:hypothetical protein
VPLRTDFDSLKSNLVRCHSTGQKSYGNLVTVAVRLRPIALNAGAMCIFEQSGSIMLQSLVSSAQGSILRAAMNAPVNSAITRANTAMSEYMSILSRRVPQSAASGSNNSPTSVLDCGASGPCGRLSGPPEGQWAQTARSARNDRTSLLGCGHNPLPIFGIDSWPASLTTQCRRIASSA